MAATWEETLLVLRRLKKEGLIVTANYSMIIANGRGTDLWSDPWLRGTILARAGLEFNVHTVGMISSLLPFIQAQNWDLNFIAGFLGKGHCPARSGPC